MAKTVREQVGVDLPEPEPLAPEPPALAERPDWLPSNFNSPEDLARSYQEAQRKITEQGERLSALEDALTVAQQAPQQQEWTQPQATADYHEQLLSAYESDPIATMAWIAQASAQQAVQQAIGQQQQSYAPMLDNQNELLAATARQEMAKIHPDWFDFEDRIAEAAQADPGLLPENELTSLAGMQRALERAYTVVKAQELLGGQQELLAQSERSRQQKLMAQTMAGGTGGARQLPSSAADDLIARMKQVGGGYGS